MNKKAPEHPTHDHVIAVLNYDQNTGLFTWRERQRSDFKSGRAYNAFNARFSGRVAGYICDHGYIRIDVGGISIRAHRLAWFYLYKEWPPEIDHIDGVRTNNALANLRKVNRRENSRNRCIRSDNTSGYHGVYLVRTPAGERWSSQISDPDGKLIILGQFVKKVDAIFARKIGEKCFGYHKNHGRQPNV